MTAPEILNTTETKIMNPNPKPNSRPARWLAVLAMLTLLVTATARAGTHQWSGDGADNLWSNPANWSIGGPPFSGEVNCFLIFPTASGYVSVNNVTNLLIARMTIQHDNYIFAASGGAKFAFRGGVSLSSSYVSTFNNSAAVELLGTNEWQIAAPGYVAVNGVVSGTGNLMKLGTGTLAFGGSAANTATGFIEVLRGELRLNKTAGVNAIPARCWSARTLWRMKESPKWSRWRRTRSPMPRLSPCAVRAKWI